MISSRGKNEQQEVWKKNENKNSVTYLENTLLAGYPDAEISTVS